MNPSWWKLTTIVLTLNPVLGRREHWYAALAPARAPVLQVLQEHVLHLLVEMLRLVSRVQQPFSGGTQGDGATAGGGSSDGVEQRGPATTSARRKLSWMMSLGVCRHSNTVKAYMLQSK